MKVELWRCYSKACRETTESEELDFDGWMDCMEKVVVFFVFVFRENFFTVNCIFFFHYLKFSNGAAPKKSKHWRKCAPCVTQPVSSRTICSNTMLQV